MNTGFLPPFFLAAERFSLYAQAKLAEHRAFERFLLLADEKADGRMQLQAVVVYRSGRRLRLVNDREQAARAARRSPGRPVRYEEIRLEQSERHRVRRVAVWFSAGKGDEIRLVLYCPAGGEGRAALLPYPAGAPGGRELEVGVNLGGRRLLPGSHAVINGRRCSLALGKSRWLRRPVVQGMLTRGLLRLRLACPPARLGCPRAQGETTVWALGGRQLRMTALPPAGGEQVFLLEGLEDYPPQRLTVVQAQEGAALELLETELEGRRAWARFSPPWPLAGAEGESDVEFWLWEEQKRPLTGLLERQGPLVQLTLQGEGLGRRTRLAYRLRREGEALCCEPAFDRL